MCFTRKDFPKILERFISENSLETTFGRILAEKSAWMRAHRHKNKLFNSVRRHIVFIFMWVANGGSATFEVFRARVQMNHWSWILHPWLGQRIPMLELDPSHYQHFGENRTLKIYHTKQSTQKEGVCLIKPGNNLPLSCNNTLKNFFQGTHYNWYKDNLRIGVFWTIPHKQNLGKAHT